MNTISGVWGQFKTLDVVYRGFLRDVWSRLKKSAPDQVKKVFSLAEKMGCMPHEYKLVFGDANVSLGFR
jgi:hypothetical protein